MPRRKEKARATNVFSAATQYLNSSKIHIVIPAPNGTEIFLSIREGIDSKREPVTAPITAMKKTRLYETESSCQQMTQLAARNAAEIRIPRKTELQSIETVSYTHLT